MAKKPSVKKVQFFEICDENGREFKKALNWDSILGGLAHQSVAQRKHEIRGVSHWGQAYTLNDREHFILARLREDGISTFDTERDEIVDQEFQAASPFVEISVAGIVEGTNKFGLIRGSNAASHATSVGEWINAHALLPKPVTIVPLLSKKTLEKINSADEVRLLDVTYSQELSASTALAEAPGLSSAVGALVEELGPADIELIVRRKGPLKDNDSEFRRRLAGLTRIVAARSYSKAKARLVTFGDDGRRQSETVDFLNDILARRMSVQVTDKEGNPVRIPSAIEAIEKAALKLRQELGI